MAGRAGLGTGSSAQPWADRLLQLAEATLADEPQSLAGVRLRFGASPESEPAAVRVLDSSSDAVPGFAFELLKEMERLRLSDVRARLSEQRSEPVPSPKRARQSTPESGDSVPASPAAPAPASEREATASPEPSSPRGTEVTVPRLDLSFMAATGKLLPPGSRRKRASAGGPGGLPSRVKPGLPVFTEDPEVAARKHLSVARACLDRDLAGAGLTALAPACRCGTLSPVFALQGLWEAADKAKPKERVEWATDPARVLGWAPTIAAAFPAAAELLRVWSTSGHVALGAALQAAQFFAGCGDDSLEAYSPSQQAPVLGLPGELGPDLATSTFPLAAVVGPDVAAALAAQSRGSPLSCQGAWDDVAAFVGPLSGDDDRLANGQAPAGPGRPRWRGLLGSIPTVSARAAERLLASE
ncbi:hypothetical protein FNF28_04303 [Cafeteria roenbergensis]|uniref:Uncharacterized protein n=1 Tax=Cafeteria roenbergensis TaxID=33653 RepID=A0A5A8DD23_CAFRO|nr:hypothetical protein FNF28_04303 [Cafeteria roenbergensis]